MDIWVVRDEYGKELYRKTEAEANTYYDIQNGYEKGWTCKPEFEDLEDVHDK